MKIFNHLWEDELRRLDRTDVRHGPLASSMRYALQGGKFVRPRLAWAIAEGWCVKGATDKAVAYWALAVEYVHAYSLVHDDLPAQDNAAFRRGKPAVHKRYGEAVAILTGNALLNRAYGLLEHTAMHAVLVPRLVRGVTALIVGQAHDLAPDPNQTPFDSQAYSMWVRGLKTGALFEVLLAGVGVLAAKGPLVEQVGDLGKDFGVAYQLRDDAKDQEAESGKEHAEQLEQYQARIQDKIHALRLPNPDPVLNTVRELLRLS